MLITVIIPSHNPDPDQLRATLLALRAQSLPAGDWEAVLINNASTRWPSPAFFDECAPTGLKIINEERLGLSSARQCGFRHAAGASAVLVDDDNVLAPDYLTAVVSIFNRHPQLGVAGGKTVPCFASPPPPWTEEFFPLLALRDLGDSEMISNGLQPAGKTQPQYPAFAPIGAGMAIRRAAWRPSTPPYRHRSLVTDRVGENLSSGGDNALVFGAMEAGWNVGYFPQLHLTHLINAERLRAKYLGRLNRSIQRSWLQVLALHGACPWPALSAESAALRKCKAWLTHRPWSSDAAYVRYQGACGHFEGRIGAQRGANHALVAPTAARALSRRLGLGRAVYGLWHAPRAAIRDTLRRGGPIEQGADWRGRRAMERAAEAFTTLRSSPPDQAELNFLTGRKFWYQTAFCLHTLQRHTGRTFRVIFHDDGTLGRDKQSRLAELFPAASFRLRIRNDERIAALLPPARYPFLNDQRHRYPNILKLTDVHAGQQGARLVADSDMLFFRRPEFVLQWLAAPDRPLHLVDIQNSYGYSSELMESLAGAPIPPRVNVGLTGLRSEQLDWDQLEFWCRRLIEAEGTQYFLEQALIAMHVAKHPADVAPESDYVIAPSRDECAEPTAVLHHYVADSKRWYFRECWRKSLRA